MDGAQLNLSRRALLGAAVGASFVSGEDTPPPSSGWFPSPANAGEEWEAAFASYVAAEGAVEEARVGCLEGSREEIRAAEEVFGDRLDALYGALRHLLAVPAPDPAALGRKVELAFEHEVATLAGCAPGIAALRRDVRRLLA